MPRKKTPAIELAENLVHVLEAQRTLGGAAYPLTLQRLGELTDAQAPPDLVFKAVASKPFKERALAATAKKLAAPVGLRDDLAQLAASTQLLEFALEQVCTPGKPATSPDKLATKLDKALRQPFGEMITRRIRENDWPATVGCQLVKDKTLVFLKRMPPRDKPEIELARNLVSVLEAQRLLGADAYPLTWERLAGLSAAPRDEKILKKAGGQEPFKSQAILGLAGKSRPNTMSPVALAVDRELLASSSLLLELALRAAATENNRAVAVADLQKRVAANLQTMFTANVTRQLEARALPPSVGWMWIGKKQQLFLLEDIHHAASPLSAPPEPTKPADDFEPAFDNAFNRLNREAGMHNFVSLVKLRQALLVPREIFDGALRRLRIAGQYSLSAAEGRHGITSAEQEAGILEDGTLLLYVSRKSP
jgi:hypothetical protein